MVNDQTLYETLFSQKGPGFPYLSLPLQPSGSAGIRR